MAQIFKAEIPFASFIPRRELQGQRLGRLVFLLSITDGFFRNAVVKSKVAEYFFALGDSATSLIAVLRLLWERFPELELSGLIAWLRRQNAR